METPAIAPKQTKNNPRSKKATIKAKIKQKNKDAAQAEEEESELSDPLS